MAGGINGGLVYFEPDAREFERMFKHLCSGKWKAVTEMAEQEFLSHWFGSRKMARPASRIQLPAAPCVSQ